MDITQNLIIQIGINSTNNSISTNPSTFLVLLCDEITCTYADIQICNLHKVQQGNREGRFSSEHKTRLLLGFQ